MIDRPLAALLPGGASSVVITRPDELGRAAAVQAWVDLVLTEEALERIEVRTGIRPAQLTELVRADYGEDRIVWLVRGAGDVDALVRAAAMRMSTVQERGEEPLRRTGYIGNRRRTWVALADDTLLVAGGHGEAEVAAIIAAAAGARRPRSEVGESPEDRDWSVDALPAPKTGGYFLANTLALYRAHRAAPFLMLVPDALGLPLDTGVGMLLARQEQMAATIHPEGEGLVVQVVLTGEFPPGAEGNFRHLIEGVAASDLGRALGLADAQDSLEIRVGEDMATGRVVWPAAGLARGIELLGGRDPWELIEGA